MSATFETFRESLKDYARDIKLNLSSVLTKEGAPGLTEAQIFGTALACAYSTKNRELIAAVSEEAAGKISDAEREASKLAATLMAMNNVYYRSIHLMTHDGGSQNLKTLPARLRMNGIAKPGIEKADFEMYCLGVSAINGCGMCLVAHEKEVTKAGFSVEGVQSALRIAAVMNAAAQAQFID